MGGADAVVEKAQAAYDAGDSAAEGQRAPCGGAVPVIHVVEHHVDAGPSVLTRLARVLDPGDKNFAILTPD